MIRSSRQAGFSLVEILVGLVLFGLLMLALTGALRAGLFGSARVEAATAALEQRQTATDVLTSLLRRADPAPDWSGRDARVAFDGARDGLSFVAVLPEGLGGALGLVRLSVADGRLIADTCAASRAAGQLACRGAAQRSVLAADLSRVTFAYFGQPGSGEGRRWLDTWRDQPDLPDAVRIAVDSVRGRWPDMILRPAIEVAP